MVAKEVRVSTWKLHHRAPMYGTDFFLSWASAQSDALEADGLSPFALYDVSVARAFSSPVSYLVRWPLDLKSADCLVTGLRVIDAEGQIFCRVLIDKPQIARTMAGAACPGGTAKGQGGLGPYLFAPHMYSALFLTRASVLVAFLLLLLLLENKQIHSWVSYLLLSAFVG